MAKIIKFRRGTTAELSAQSGVEAELFVDTNKETLVVMDGLTPGGYPLARESQVTSVSSTLTTNYTAAISSNSSIITTNYTSSISNVSSVLTTNYKAADSSLSSTLTTNYTAAITAATGSLGTMSTQNAGAVAVTGGTITGTTINSNVVGANSVGARTIQSTSAGVPTGGSSGDIVYQY